MTRTTPSRHGLAPAPRSLRGRLRSVTDNNRLLGSLAGVAAATLVVATVPATVGQTVASWGGSEWVHAPAVGTSAFDCGTDTNYRTTSSGTFLSGQLLGIDLDDIAELRDIRTVREPGQPVVVDPPNAVDLGGTNPEVSTYANPLAVSVLDDLAVLDLTGLSVGLPAGSTGAVNQYSQSSTLGTSAGAAGLVTNSGGVGVTSTTPDSELPEPATLQLSNVLAPLTGVGDVSLEVGAVAASSALDWCAARESDEWGDGSVTGVTRDYGIAGLDLVVDSPLVSGLVTEVNDTVTDLNTAVTALSGVNGGIANLVRAQVAANLPGLLGVNLGGNVTISNLNLTGAVQNLLTTPLTDGTVTIDLSAGTVSVDLASLLGDGANGLNDLSPNTELLINNAVLNPLVDRVGDLLDAWTTQVTQALTTALDNATVTIDLSGAISILGSGPNSGLQVATLDVDVNASIASIRAGTAPVTIDTDVVGAVTVVNIILGGLGLPTITTILSTLTSGLTTGLLAPIAATLSTNLFGLVTTLGSTLATAVNPILTAVGGVFNALPSVLSVGVNVQPDQPNPLPGSTFDPGAAPLESPEYAVSALRIGLVDAVAPTNGFVYFSLATATAGPTVALP
ncbi:hypothetical protein ALI44B_10065 [Leifsonia sp. ALI-44-B]|uniref:choice-of-anchor G family protein n=1 Tax=Leifsonia sp. ALI-44-B TaxID=1933776 RepID=UPI00097C5189|nr:choice-of-anchor G family protein [Leifsonia sp. ALI-44-B]ONI60886.1 hypothetical protein ALI44B_10065 [Leifsonia sp. ALI-44-B]